MKQRMQVTFIILVLMVTVMPMFGAENAEGIGRTIESDAALDGEIQSYDPNYRKALNVTGNISADAGQTSLRVGQSGGAVFFIYRIFQSFDTSEIAEDEEIISCELNMRLQNDFSSDDFDCEVYQCNYGGNLGAGDFNESGDFEGILLNSSLALDGNWYSMVLSTDSINTVGNTQFSVRSSKDGSEPTSSELLRFYSGDSSGNEPYLSITSQLDAGAIIFYNFTQAGMTNRSVTAMPVEIISHNNTHELVRYEFPSLNTTSINFTLDGNYSYANINPYASITDYGNGIFNITDMYESTEYHIWFYRESQYKTTFFISMWSPNGYSDMPMLGYFWESWQVFYSTGSTFDADNATQVPNPTIELDYGTYTFGVLDHFGEELASQTAVANAPEKFIKIVVPAYEMAINSLSQYDVEMQIYTSSNLSAAPIEVNICSGQARYRYLRGTEYTINVSFIGTTSTGTFYRNVSGPLILRINGTTIEELQETSNNIFEWVQVITTWVTPAINLECYELPSTPDEGTRSSSGTLLMSSGTRAFRIHPFHVMWFTTSENITGTTGSFYDPTPSTGTTYILKDEITIDSAWNTNVMLNYTNGTNFVNLTHPQTVDLTGYADSENFTLWANDTVNALRTNRVKNENVFNWTYYPDEDRYFSQILIAATGPYEWKSVFWKVMGVNGTKFDYSSELRQPIVWDVNNSVYLENGLHYTTNDQGFEMEWNDLGPNTWRAFSFRYYTENQTYNPTEIITLNQKGQDSLTFSESYWHGVAEYRNANSNTFTGQLVIRIEGLGANIIDPDSMIVFDENMDVQLGSEDFYFSGNSIVIAPSGLPGGVGSGETQTFKVFWHYSDAKGTDTGLFKKWGGLPLSWHNMLIVLAVILTAYALIFAKDRTFRDYDLKIVLLEFSAMLVGIWAILLVSKHQGVMS